jgi:Putative adhesin
VTAPARPRPNAGVVAAAVLLVVVVAVSGATQLFSQVVESTLERTTTFTPVVDRFAVDDAGDVAITPSSDGRVHVRTVVRHGLGRPDLMEESTPSGVRLDVDCNALLASRCDVRYEVELPPSFEVVVGGSAGDVTARGLTGPLRVDRDEGEIALFGVTGPLDVTTTSGDITGLDLRSQNVRAESRSGDVRLALLEPPQSVQVHAVTGDVDVAVPAGGGYRVSASTHYGDRSVTVPLDPAAERAVTVDSSNGDVRVRTALLPPAPPTPPAPPEVEGGR